MKDMKYKKAVAKFDTEKNLPVHMEWCCPYCGLDWCESWAEFKTYEFVVAEEYFRKISERVYLLKCSKWSGSLEARGCNKKFILLTGKPLDILADRVNKKEKANE